jgi:hypothetical protein
MKTTMKLDEIRVASPCNARWNDMDGDERARFCRQCSKHVFNLSTMTRAEIETLIREKEGNFCGRFYRRTDGSLLTADCPSRLRQLRERAARFGGALCALALSILGCARQASTSHGERTGKMLMGDVALQPTICATNSPEIMGKIAVPSPRDTNPPALIGEVYVPPQTGSSSLPN